MADITSDNYAAAAVSTECPYEGAIERLGGPVRLLDALVYYLVEARRNGDRQDEIKKAVFYGKDMPVMVSGFRRIGKAEKQAFMDRLTADPRIIRLLHAVIGLQTEVSELQSALTAYLMEGTPIDWTNISEETGDECWYLGIIADILKTPLTQILQQNIDKLRLRYPNKFSSFDALNRNLSTERTFLEESTVCS